MCVCNKALDTFSLSFSLSFVRMYRAGDVKWRILDESAGVLFKGTMSSKRHRRHLIVAIKNTIL